MTPPKSKPGTRNPEASLQQRLRNHARATGDDVSLVLTRYVSERFLYRLSLSPHRDRFILRGATLFTVWNEEPHRATRDIDLLASGDTSLDTLRRLLSDICRQPVPADFSVKPRRTDFFLNRMDGPSKNCFGPFIFPAGAAQVISSTDIHLE